MLRRRQDELPRSAPLDTQTPNFSLKIEQFLELLVQGDAKDQRQLGGGIELPRLSMELMVLRDTPTSSASWVWDSPFSARATFSRFFRIS